MSNYLRIDHEIGIRAHDAMIAEHRVTHQNTVSASIAEFAYHLRFAMFVTSYGFGK